MEINMYGGRIMEPYPIYKSIVTDTRGQTIKITLCTASRQQLPLGAEVIRDSGPDVCTQWCQKMRQKFFKLPVFNVHCAGLFLAAAADNKTSWRFMRKPFRK